jgi:hypothetical protein
MDSILNIFVALSYEDPFIISWVLFKSGGWVVFLFVLFWGFWQIYLKNIQDKYDTSVNYTILAIDIPKSNEQSVKAMEQFFAHLSGAHFSLNLIKKYWQGKTQLGFSMELISLDGYIQFLVRTPTKYRDLVESAIYAQYPDAEITEVRDYVENIPDLYPNEEYELWGTQFGLANKDAYPIRTYTEFEHSLSSLEQQFLDPMAALLESLSKLRNGEQVWLQILITPIDDKWREEGMRLVKKLIKAKIEEKGTLLDRALELPIKLLGEVSDEIFPLGLGGETVKEPPPSIMQHLSPGEKAAVEAIQNKISKIGFKVKFRMIYVAKKEIFNRPRGVAPIMGALKQFNTLNLNAFKPIKKITTKINYFFIQRRTNTRRNKIIKAFKLRSQDRGARAFILNIEELASIFHFPILTVKAPLLKKTESKKAEPPVSLPLAEEEMEEIMAPEEGAPKTIEELKEEKVQGLAFDYDNPYFEEKFALDKNKLKQRKEKSKEKGINNKPPSNLPIVK